MHALKAEMDLECLKNQYMQHTKNDLKRTKYLLIMENLNQP